MKYLNVIVLCLFLIGISAVTFAADPVQVKQPEQNMEMEGDLMLEAKELPSTLMTDTEERVGMMDEDEEFKEAYGYLDDTEYDD